MFALTKCSEILLLIPNNNLEVCFFFFYLHSHQYFLVHIPDSILMSKLKIVILNENLVATCWSGYHYRSTSFNKTGTHVLCRFKSCTQRVGGCDDANLRQESWLETTPSSISHWHNSWSSLSTVVNSFWPKFLFCITFGFLVFLGGIKHIQLTVH